MEINNELEVFKFIMLLFINILFNKEEKIERFTILINKFHDTLN